GIPAPPARSGETERRRRYAPDRPGRALITAPRKRGEPRSTPQFSGHTIENPLISRPPRRRLIRGLEIAVIPQGLEGHRFHVVRQADAREPDMRRRLPRGTVNSVDFPYQGPHAARAEALTGGNAEIVAFAQMPSEHIHHRSMLPQRSAGGRIIREARSKIDRKDDSGTRAGMNACYATASRMPRMKIAHQRDERRRAQNVQLQPEEERAGDER